MTVKCWRCLLKVSPGFTKKCARTRDVQPALLELITHFFEHYKDLEPNKWVTVDGWEGADAAEVEILESIGRYDQLPEKPHF